MFHPMVAGVTDPGRRARVARDHAVHRQEPVEQARRPQVRDHDDDDVHDDVGRARHHRVVLPGSGLQLRVPLERRHLLRAVRSRSTRWRSPSPSSSSCWSPAVTMLRDREPAPCDDRRRCQRETRQRDAVARATDGRRPTTSRVDRARSDRAANAPTRRAPASRAMSRHARRGEVVRVGTGRRGRARRHRAASSSTAACSRASGFSLAGVLGAGVPRRSCGRPERAASAARSTPATSTTSWRQIDATKRSRSTCPTPRTYIQPYPADDIWPRRRCLRTRRCSPGWRKASSRCTSGACTSGAACRGARRRSGSSARATVRSTTGSARSATARRRAASTGSS